MEELQYDNSESSWRPPSFSKTIEAYVRRFEDGIKCLRKFSESLQIRSDRTTRKCAAALSYDLCRLARWLVQALQDAMARDVFTGNAVWVRMMLSRLQVRCYEYVGVALEVVRLREERSLRKLQNVLDTGLEDGVAL